MGFWMASDETVINGWPLYSPRMATAMIAQFYDQQESTISTNFAQTGGQQPVSTLPTWTSIYITVDNQTYTPTVDPRDVSEYVQNMSIRDGIVSTSLVWKGLWLNYTILVHRTRPTLGIVRLEIKGLTSDMEVTITDLLDGAGSWRTTFSDSFADALAGQLTAIVSPNGIGNVTPRG
jgi:trehalose/maltose hydrolase-like predicted phosphorylase